MPILQLRLSTVTADTTPEGHVADASMIAFTASDLLPAANTQSLSFAGVITCWAPQQQRPFRQYFHVINVTVAIDAILLRVLARIDTKYFLMLDSVIAGHLGHICSLPQNSGLMPCSSIAAGYPVLAESFSKAPSSTQALKDTIMKNLQIWKLTPACGRLPERVFCGAVCRYQGRLCIHCCPSLSKELVSFSRPASAAEPRRRKK